MFRVNINLLFNFFISGVSFVAKSIFHMHCVLHLFTLVYMVYAYKHLFSVNTQLNQCMSYNFMITDVCTLVFRIIFLYF